MKRKVRTHGLAVSLLGAAISLATITLLIQPATGESDGSQANDATRALQFRGALTGLQGRCSVEQLRIGNHGVPTYIRGDLTPVGSFATAEDLAHAFFAESAAVFGMSDPRQDLQLERSKRDAIGMSHVRFRQVHDGVEVWGGELIVHVTREKRIRSVSGSFVPGIAVATVPTLDDMRARGIAGARVGDVAVDANLAVAPIAVGDNRLVWRCRIPAGPEGGLEVFVDAHTGDVVLELPLWLEAEGR